MRKFIVPIIAVSALFAATDEVKLELNEPTICEKCVQCSQGGAIKTEEITIYAKNFDYIKDDDGTHSVKASGNLLIKFNRYFFVGDSITYDFDEKKGTIINGIGTVNNIISGGSKIHLHKDKSLEINDAFITPSLSNKPVFEITSPQVKITDKTKASAKTMVGKLNGVPFMWLPGWGMTLDSKFKTPRTLSYAMTVEHGQVPMIWARYMLLNNNAFQLYTRIEYRFLQWDKNLRENWSNGPWYEGLGGAADLDYKTDDKKITFQSRNFATYNIWYLNPDANKPALRYRIQGKYKGLTNDDAVETLIQWDKLSDRFLRSDFPAQTFDIKTLERNEAFLHYRIDPAYISVSAKPRLNSYRGFKQELPLLQIAARPIEILKDSKIYLEQTYSGGYLAYLYARQLQGVIQDFSSGRFAANLNLYRPFGYGPINFTPRVGFDGIAYTHNQHIDSSYQAVCSYGADANIEFQGDFSSFTHYVKPYAKYNGLTSPSSGNNQHFNFSIKDGYAALNQLIFGLNNEIYFDRFPVDVPTLGLDVKGMSFFNTSAPGQPVPLDKPVSKAMVDAIWHYPRMEVGAGFGWNFEKEVYDFIEARFGWTVNDYIALSTTYRDRGKFWWRKDNHQSFVLDSFRLIEDMDDTPLSDARYCFVNKLQMQIAPLWTLQVENNVGRRPSVYNDLGQVIKKQTPFYTQTKFNLSMVITNSYRIGLSYLVSNSTKDNYFTVNFDLM